METEITRTTRDLRPEQIAEFVTSPRPTILEIGCNDGTDTNRIMDTFPDGLVFCFEPDPRAIARFLETVHDDRATLVEAAVSDEDGETVFFGSSGRPPGRERGPKASHYCHLDEWDLSGSICKPTGHLDMSPWVTFPPTRRYTVKTIRLDTWYEQTPGVGVIDFIWADVQGAEGLLIKGACNALRLTRYFYVETRVQGGRMTGKELYEGQPDVDQLRRLVPQMDLISFHGDNALFRNPLL